MAERAAVHSQMTEIRDIVNGDADLPTDELSEESKPAVANLISQGGTQMALRCASVLPDLSLPPLRPESKQSQRRSAEGRKAVFGMWEHNRMRLILRKRARYLLFDGETPIVVVPDFKARIPRWEVRDPINSYPPPGMGLSPIVEDCIFTYTQTYRWLRDAYPEAAGRMPETAREPDATVLLLEYWDEQDRVLVAIGSSRRGRTPSVLYQPPGRSAAFPYKGGETGSQTTSWWSSTTGSSDYESVECERYAHGLEMCPVVYPTRITLDRLQGQFDQLIGLYIMQAKLMALSVIGVQRGVLPEVWLESSQANQTGKIVQKADARTGKVGIVQDGRLVPFRTEPGFQTGPMLDRLEYAIRQSGGIPPEFGGSSQSNVRTGRRGENILSAAIDFPIQEAQEILGFSLQAETQIAIATSKRHWGNREVSYFVDWKGAKGRITYRPNKVFESDEVRVSYAMAGSDSNQVVIGGGQRLGLKTLSRRSFQKLDGWVEDPEFEHDQITAEGLEDALLASLQQQAAAGALPPTDLARVIELIKSDRMELPEAVARVQQEAQERQATPVEAGAPEAEPGIAVPGAGAEQPIETIEGPPRDLSNLTSLLGALRLPQQMGRAERGQSIAGGR
ncbi:MAG: hypothetical protein WAT66_14560 [Actinomycetota bacterium]